MAEETLAWSLKHGTAVLGRIEMKGEGVAVVVFVGVYEGWGGAGDREKQEEHTVRMTSIRLYLSVVALSPPTGDEMKNISVCSYR